MSKSKQLAKNTADSLVYGTVRSCDRCKEKKIRCNNAVPCSQCTTHGATCTYNTPYRRKRYAVVQTNSAQKSEEAEIKIIALEEQLEDYKKKMAVLEKNLLKYLSPVPSEARSPFDCPPIEQSEELIEAYYDAGRWIGSHFDGMFDQIRKQNTRSKELSWQLVHSFNKNYIENHISQLSTEGLIDILSWINVFLMGELLSDKTIFQSDIVNVAISVITALFFHRGVQFDAVQAQRMISNLVMFCSYLKMSQRMPAYVTSIGFLLQLVQIYENVMEPSLVFSTYSTLLVSTVDKARRESFMIKYHSQPVAPPLIEFVKFQLSGVLSALLLGEIYSKQSMRTMIASVREIDESLEALKGSQFYDFFKIWACAAEAEFAYNLNDMACYQAKTQQAIDHYNLMTSPRFRTRMATLFSTIVLLVESRGLYFRGSSFKILPPRRAIKSDEMDSSDYYESSSN